MSSFNFYAKITNSIRDSQNYASEIKEKQKQHTNVELHELTHKWYFLFTIQHLIWLTIFLINLQLNDKDTNLKHEFDIFFFLSIYLLRISLICFKTIHHFQLIYFICLLVFDVKMRFFLFIHFMNVSLFFLLKWKPCNKSTENYDDDVWLCRSLWKPTYIAYYYSLKHFIVISKHVCDYSGA